MKYLIQFGLLFLFFCKVGYTQSLSVTEIQKDFYLCTSYKLYDGKPFPSNSMYVVSSEGVILIDTPWDTIQVHELLAYIAQHENKPMIACFVTHWHDDRTAGVSILEWNGIKTYATQQTIDLCRIQKEQIPQNPVSTDTVITYGDKEFELYYPGKGHSQDNIVIWFPEQRLLYGGCLIKSLENSGIGNLSDADVKQWEISMRKVNQKYVNALVVIPGHFGYGDAALLRHTSEIIQKELQQKH